MKDVRITYNENITDPGACDPVPVKHFFSAVLNGRWRKEVLTCRQIKDKTKYRDYKKDNIPAVMFGGVFTYRSEAHLKKHSGLLCIDIDAKDQDKHFDAEKCKQLLAKKPYAVFTAKSVGGNGVFLVAKIKSCKPDEHSEYYKQIADDLPYKVDTAPANVASARFVSYDKEAILNDKPKAFKLTPCNDTSRTNPLKRHPGDNVLNSNNTADKLTVWFERKQFDPNRRNNSIFILAAAFNKFGVAKDTAIDYCMQYKKPQAPDKEVLQVVNSAYKSTTEFNTKAFDLPKVQAYDTPPRYSPEVQKSKPKKAEVFKSKIWMPDEQSKEANIIDRCKRLMTEGIRKGELHNANLKVEKILKAENIPLDKLVEATII